MSFQTFCGQDPADANTYQKILGKFMEGGAAAALTLGAVLEQGNSALSPTTGLPQDATDFDKVGCVEIETGKVYQGNNLTLQIGEAGDTLQIKGATAKGSLLVGNGANTEEFAVPAPPPPNGSVLILDDTQPLGVRWGGESGPIATITAGNNIDILGTSANPIVAFQNPTTSNILLGVGTFIQGKDNYATPNYTMTLDATGFNDAYVVGSVENKEDIAVSATNVVDTISTTNTTDYINTAILTCDTNFISDVKTSQILTSGSEKTASASISCNTAGVAPTAQIGCGVVAPTSPPNPDISASVSMGCSDATNPTFSISQSTPFGITYSTTIGKDGINQNNSGGTGFSIQSAQDVSLLPTSNLILTADNIDLDATGRLICPSLASTNYLDYNTGKLTIVNNSVAGSANPLLVLQNNNNTAGATTFETYKNDAPTSTGGDEIGIWSSTCNTNAGNRVELTRITNVAYGTTSGNNDGGIRFGCKINGTLNKMMDINGGVGSGAIQVFKPIQASGTGSTNIELDATSSAGAGDINLTAKGDVDITSNGAGGSVDITAVSNVNINATGDNMVLSAGSAMTLATTGTGTNIEFKPEATAGGIVFTGAALQSNTSSGNSGEHLVITLNGTQYKIALQNV